MPNSQSKSPANQQGHYYVDTDCIDCSACREIAPRHFGFDENTGLSYVMRQPETAEEKEIMNEAMDQCPTESIGSDGEGAA